jgi:hypothetical protein
MKFENKDGSVKVTNAGDSHKFTISDESAVMVIDSLINLYSDPIGSLIRELVSNAVDANRERDLKIKGEVPLDAGDDINNFAKDKPYVEVINQNGNSMLGVEQCIVIRDYGNGLSPDRVAKVFTVLGTSTKRITDKLIGGYGIGAKSAFAYTDTFYVKATHNKVERMYMLYKGNALPEMTLVNEVAVDSCNSTEVIIPLKDRGDVVDFENAIKEQLIFFNNVVYKGFMASFGIPKEVFSTDNVLIAENTNTSKVKCIVGRVVYPIDYDLIPELKDDSRKLSNAFLRFKIGEVDLVPSRENLRYTDKTIEAIVDKFNTASGECDTGVVNKLEGETDFLTWYLGIYNMPNFTARTWSISVSDNRDNGVSTMIQLGAVNTDTIDLSSIVDKQWPEAPRNIVKVLTQVFRGSYSIGLEVKEPEQYWSQAFSSYRDRLGTVGIIKLFEEIICSSRTKTIYHVPGNYSGLKTKALMELHDKNFYVFKTDKDVGKVDKRHTKFNFDYSLLIDVKEFIYDQIMKVHGNISNYDDVDTSDLNPEDDLDISIQEYRKLNKTIFFKELYRDQYPNDSSWEALPFCMMKEGLKISDLEDYVQNGTEIIYGYSDDDELLRMCGGILFSVNQPTTSHNRTTLGNYKRGLKDYMIIKVAKNLSKELAQFTYVKDFYMDRHKDLVTYMTSQLCSEHMVRIKASGIFNSSDAMRIIDPDVSAVFDKAQERYEDYENCHGYIYGTNTIIQQVKDLCSEEGIYDKSMVDSVNALAKYLDEFPVLEYALDIDGNPKVIEQMKLLKETLGVTLDKCPYLEAVETEIPELNEN